MVSSDMRMADPIPTFSYVVEQIKARHPDFAYIHLVEPRVKGAETLPDGAPEGEQNDFIRAIWSPRPLVTAGGYDRKIALEVAEEKGDIIAFGRHFISNVSLIPVIFLWPTLMGRVQPDLPLRLEKDIPLHPYDRSTFYAAESPVGYIDQPFADHESETFVTKL
jgi:NADPH2 dehydrogenase